MVPDKEDTVHIHVSDTSFLPSERLEISITSEYDVSVFREIEAAVDEASNIVCNNELDIVDMLVEHNEIEIAWFLEGGCLCKLLCIWHTASISLQY